MNEPKKPEREFPDIKQICLDVPLYESFPFTESDVGGLYNIEYFEGTFDCYCIDCNKLSVFRARKKMHKPPHIGVNILEDHIYDHYFDCSRDHSHNLFFLIMISEHKLTKIGQYPSMADIISYEIQKYRRILHSETYKEFSRAVGLVSHGIGIGAFVYLRRIFEGLILEAHGQAEIMTDWDEDLYQRSRMDEKINLLKDFLPSFMVEHKSLYSILSKGIHELSEDECLGAFPIVKTGIELILDEKITEHKRQAKEAEGRKAISKLTGELKGS